MNEIIMAAKIYEYRDACKKIWGNDWKSKITPNMDLINAAMKNHSIDNEVEAALILIKEMKNKDTSGVLTMKFIAAAVELIEPSNS